MSGENREGGGQGGVVALAAVLTSFTIGMLVGGEIKDSTIDLPQSLLDIQQDNTEVRVDLEGQGYTIGNLILVNEDSKKGGRTFSFDNTLSEGKTSTCEGSYEITEGVASIVGRISCTQ